MAIERTLSIIKPDAVAGNHIGEIYSRFEKAGLKVVAAKMLHLDNEKAGGFYAEHKERPFYNDLVSFMTSGPVVVSVLEDAAEGTIRRDFANSIDENAVHGSDSTTSAAREISYFFNDNEVCPRTR